MFFFLFFFFKQKTAYEMRISDWSSDVCSSDLALDSIEEAVTRLKSNTDLPVAVGFGVRTPEQAAIIGRVADGVVVGSAIVELIGQHGASAAPHIKNYIQSLSAARSEEHTSELQSLMPISYAVFCLHKKHT